ncbi:hypothetical protein GA0115240_16185 [Streptomyces sp. DvalAA-14]|nr:hypothetical protein GA0115240_16185 [Streptomyces sp. DvalAA-14]
MTGGPFGPGVTGPADAGPGGGGEPESSDSLRTFGAVVQALREHAGLRREEFGEAVRKARHTVASGEMPGSGPLQLLETPENRVVTADARSLGRVWPGSRAATAAALPETASRSPHAARTGTNSGAGRGHHAQ